MEENIKKIKEKYTPQLLKYNGVVGVGIGKIATEIKVMNSIEFIKENGNKI